MFRKGKNVMRFPERTVVLNKLRNNDPKKSLSSLKAAFISPLDLNEFGYLYVCSVCCGILRSEKALRDHIRFSHLEISFCRLCSLKNVKKEFGSPSGCNKHLKMYHKHEVKDQLLQNYRGIRFRTRKMLGRGFREVAQLKDFQHSDLVKILERFCKQEKIKLIRSSKTQLLGRKAASESMEQSSESLQEGNKMESVEDEEEEEAADIPEGSNSQSSPEMSKNDNEVDQVIESSAQDTSSFSVPLISTKAMSTSRESSPDFYFRTPPLQSSEELSSSQDLSQFVVNTPPNQLQVISWLVGNNELKTGRINFPKIIPFRHNNSLFENLEKRCNEKLSVQGKLAIYRDGNSENPVVFDKEVFCLWNESSMLDGEEYSSVVDLSVETLERVRGLFYCGRFLGSVHELVGILNILPLKPAVSSSIVAAIASCESLSEIMEWMWSSDNAKSCLDSHYLIDLSLAYMLRNMDAVISSSRPFISFPKELLRCLLPENILSTIKRVHYALDLHSSRPALIQFFEGRNYLSLSHHQLSEYLFKWGKEQCTTKECTVEDLQREVQELMSIVCPAFLNLSHVILFPCSCGHLAARGVYYHNLLTTSSPFIKRSIPECYEETVQVTRLCGYCKEVNSDKSIMHDVIEKDFTSLFKKLLKDELQNSHQADITFTTCDGGSMRANSFIINSFSENILPSLGVNEQDMQIHNPANPKLVHVFCSIHQLNALLTVCYEGRVIAEHADFLLYLGLLYGSNQLRDESLRILETQSSFLTNPIHALLLFISYQRQHEPSKGKDCENVLRKNWNEVMNSEVFLSLSNEAEVKLLFKLAGTWNHDVTTALHCWCVVQQLVKNGAEPDLPELHGQFRRLLKMLSTEIPE